jgi:hypothetical protein
MRQINKIMGRASMPHPPDAKIFRVGGDEGASQATHHRFEVSKDHARIF